MPKNTDKAIAQKSMVTQHPKPLGCKEWINTKIPVWYIYFKLVCEQQNVKADQHVVHKVQADRVLCLGYVPEKVALIEIAHIKHKLPI
jgi:hypothetical protein